MDLIALLILWGPDAYLFYLVPLRYTENLKELLMVKNAQSQVKDI